MTKSVVMLAPGQTGAGPTGIRVIRKVNTERDNPGNQNPNPAAATTIASTSLKQWSQNLYKVDTIIFELSIM